MIDLMLLYIKPEVNNVFLHLIQDPSTLPNILLPLLLTLWRNTNITIHTKIPLLLQASNPCGHLCPLPNQAILVLNKSIILESILLNKPPGPLNLNPQLLYLLISTLRTI